MFPVDDDPEFVLLSDIHDSEIFEVPTDAQGQLSLQTVKAIGGSRYFYRWKNLVCVTLTLLFKVS